MLIRPHQTSGQLGWLTRCYRPCSWVLLLAAAFSGHRVALAQPAFAPPPLPVADPADAPVRGIYDPNQPPPSPGSAATPAAVTRNWLRAHSPQTTVNSATQVMPGGEIVARVDGQIVLASDILWQVNHIIRANRERIPPSEVEKVRRQILRQQVLGLIDTKLLYADFRRKVPAENIPSIEQNLVKPFEEMEIPRLAKMLEVQDRRGLAKLLAENEISISDVQHQFVERTIAGEWLRQLAPQAKSATHEEMLAYYQAHAKDYEYPAQVKWEEVAIRFDRVGGNRKAAWQACANLGNEIWKEVLANPGMRGAIFTELAKTKSHGYTAKNGGLHDWTTKGALRSEVLNEALFSLQVGQLSNILESKQGFHIVRVLDRKTAGRTPFTEAQAEIREQLNKARQQELVEAEMVKLRQKSRVWTVFDGDLNGPELAQLLSGDKSTTR